VSDGEVRFQRAPHVLWRSTLETVVLLPAGRDEPFALAGTGPELWALLTEARTFAAAVALLADVHGADPEVVARDLEPLLERLVEQGAVVRG
jgi:hypothetical protein